jgi:hypothetical protein
MTLTLKTALAIALVIIVVLAVVNSSKPKTGGVPAGQTSETGVDLKGGEAFGGEAIHLA